MGYGCKSCQQSDSFDVNAVLNRNTNYFVNPLPQSLPSLPLGPRQLNQVLSNSASGNDRVIPRNLVNPQLNYSAECGTGLEILRNFTRDTRVFDIDTDLLSIRGVDLLAEKRRLDGCQNNLFLFNFPARDCRGKGFVYNALTNAGIVGNVQVANHLHALENYVYNFIANANGGVIGVNVDPTLYSDVFGCIPGSDWVYNSNNNNNNNNNNNSNNNANIIGYNNIPSIAPRVSYNAGSGSGSGSYDDDSDNGSDSDSCNECARGCARFQCPIYFSGEGATCAIFSTSIVYLQNILNALTRAGSAACAIGVVLDPPCAPVQVPVTVEPLGAFLGGLTNLPDVRRDAPFQDGFGRFGTSMRYTLVWNNLVSQWQLNIVFAFTGTYDRRKFSDSIFECLTFTLCDECTNGPNVMFTPLSNFPVTHVETACNNTISSS